MSNNLKQIIKEDYTISAMIPPQIKFDMKEALDQIGLGVKVAFVSIFGSNMLLNLLL